MKPFVTKWIGGVLLMFLSLLNLQAQTDTLCNPNENKKLFGELYFSYGSAVNVFSQFNRSTFLVGQPLVSTQNMLSRDNQAGFGAYSAWFLPPQPPILVATQGDFKDRIRLSWNVNPLSPVPTGFTIFRDGSYLTDLGEDVRQFLDFNTQAGEYYEYSIVAKNVFGTGSPNISVGFVNPNGVVSGKISTNSGNPVPDVEVRLTPLTGSSMAFDGVDDQLCVSYNDKFPTDKFTVSAYVKFPAGTNTNNEAGIIDWGSGLNKNWWITTTANSEKKGYIFHVGNGIGEDSLKYIIPVNSTNYLANDEKWHQITLVYNGAALSVMVDGEFVGTKPATIVREKQHFNIGSKNNGGYFKGLIDDVRIYDRPLTQTEVNATKNRSVSKTENGLVAYWKMDEGIGLKVFDNANTPINANLYPLPTGAIKGPAFSSDRPEVYSAGVSDVTGYYVIDGINYSVTESFRATPMKNFEYNSAIEFNASDKSYGNLTDFDMPDTATVQVLFHPFDLKSRQTVLSKGSLYELYVDNSKLYLNLNGNLTDLGVIKAKYYHVAVALNNTNGTAKVYLEGALAATVSFSGTSNWATGIPWLLATNSTNATTGKFYTGLIDEFAIYKTALPQNQIEQHFVTGIPQDATTKDLFTYFDLNEGSDTKVYDYAAINFGAALPREGTLTKANWSSNARRKQSIAHEFEPNVRVVNLNSSNTAIGNIDFKNVSTVNVSGTVRFANTFCFAEKVEILVNGQSYFPQIFTDIKGKWSADFEPGRSVKLTAQYGDHLFSPGFFELRKLQAPKAGVVFLDNTKRTIRGQVAGNELCRKSIIPAGSRVIVKVATLDGCFERTDTLRNPDGRYVFNNLPARAFRVSVVEHSNPVIYDFLQAKGGREVDLRDSARAVVDFIYTAPPNVEIQPFPEIVCAGGTKFSIIPQTPSELSPKYQKKIKVFEIYSGGGGDEKCYVPQAKLFIDNKIQGTGLEEADMDSSVYVYKFMAGIPNILPPYKKFMQVRAVVNGASATALDEVIVVGKKSRASTFTTDAPSDKPIWILRDPPGDASFATLESGTTKCTAYANSFVKSTTGSLSGAVEIGKKVETVVGGPGVAVIEENGAVVTNTIKGTVNYTGNINNETEVCFTTTESYSTSESDVVVGRMADVFIGTSMNFEYGINDMIYFDAETCQVKDTVGIWLNPKKFGTQYVYSRFQIENDVIPSLIRLGKIKEAKGWEKILKEDEYYLRQKPEYSNRINDIINDVIRIIPASEVVPKKILDPIKKIINTTIDLAEEGIKYILGANDAPDTVRYEPVFSKNVTFDGLSNFTSSFTKEDTKARTTTWSLGADFTATVNGEVTVFGLDVDATVETTSAGSYENTTANTETKTTTIAYTLADDDVGDNFSVDIFRKGDLPVFKLKAGESMCPWELNTSPRSEPSLISIDGNSKINVPANTQAVYQVELGNLSPTENAMNYDISMETGTNPNGAIVKIDGQVLTQPITYRIPYGETRKVIVTIDRGPLAYTYEGIVLQFESACETELADARGGDPVIDSLFVRTIELNAYFIEPCSPVDIGFPLQGFVVTPAAENKLSITLNEYNKNDADLKQINLQYRPIGGDGSWIKIDSVMKVDLDNVSELVEWNTALLKDGEYEVRAVAECFNVSLKPGISTVIKGEIARNPPELVGVPEPGDGTWDPGDEISITFNEPIDCDKVFQADIRGNNTIGLYDATTNALVAATISCVGNKIIIVPTIDKSYENRTFRVQVTGKYTNIKSATLDPNRAAGIRDKAGNIIDETIKWEFAYNQNNLEWVGADVIETNEVLKPFTVKRQIRNRGGSIASFRMESIPSWLTVTPSTGTLNPGQVADVTLTFQQDLLIGDYLDTLQMVGSKGAEPLLIDYRVRCPQPKYEVINPEQYEGTMNMVVDLSIFGVSSTDPSDVIVAKIGGQVRGVGRVAYYRNIPADKQRWLTFLTVYGNPDDEDKPIEFTIWDGSKCNEYVEILENYTYRDGSLVGSPLVPTPVSVLNLVKKCIPLNRGFNWVSFNLNLGTDRNTVSNMLSSLKNKTGAYIKTDNSFAEYLPNYGWDALDSVIYPTKRYMVFVLARDTVCIKGAPYEVGKYPIAIKNSWNWIGYVPSTGMTVTQALKGLTPLNGDIIKSQTLFAQFVAGVGWIGNLSFLEPLKGYLLKISNAGTLTYPTTTTSSTSGLTDTINPLDEKEVTQYLKVQSMQEASITFDFMQYEQTMNLIGKVNGMEIDDEDELRAYIDGVLVGANKAIVDKKERLFFQTIYYQDEQNIQFKLFKADRNKEFSLDKSVMFKPETLVGLVETPVVFNLVTSSLPSVTIKVEDNVIKQPVVVFPTVSVPASIVESNTNCASYSVSTILPLGTETKPTCSATTLEANMSAVIRVRFNERTNFVSDNDVLTFINPITNAVLGCATFDGSNKLFYGTIAGITGSATSPVDVRYFSNTMKKTFTLKSAITYRVNSRLGNALAPNELDFSPLSVTISNGIVTAAMRDTSWTGDYKVNVFALNCAGYNDGQTTFSFYRLKSGDCLEVIDRKITEIEAVDNGVIQAIKITSQATINSGFNINYKGGNVIELKPGFDAKSGAIFTGKIEGCNNK